MSNNVYYFGLLGNVNHSIQRINIDKDLTIEKWSKDKIIKFLNETLYIDPYEAEFRYRNHYGCGYKNSAYVITGLFSTTSEPQKKKIRR